MIGLRVLEERGSVKILRFFNIKLLLFYLHSLKYLFYFDDIFLYQVNRTEMKQKVLLCN